MTLTATDVVGIFDEDFNQVFPNARPLKATVNRQSKSFEHPVEDGQTVVDDKVILPVEIQFPVILSPENFQDVYAQLVQSFINSDFFIIQTKAGIFENQYLTAVPHEEDSKIANTLAIALSFKEAQVQQAVFGTLPASAVADPQDSSTVDRGEQNGVQQSAAADLLDTITELF
ncbi:MAG: hypothetical protein KAJ19_28080 [Gammaproteobacteria bacterium]|nr:hypothetical protein [Gammaproteobacteria bacterium]